MQGLGVKFAKPWLVAKGTSMIPIFPIVARDENSTVPSGKSGAEQDLSPCRGAARNALRNVICRIPDVAADVM